MGSKRGLSPGAEHSAPRGRLPIDRPQRRETVTGPQLREAERAFVAMLRTKGFPAAWIERNLLDLLAQASSEYAGWLRDHEPEENPVGWLITCAYRHAVNLLEYQRRRPPTSSVEEAVPIADETPTPEQELLHDERQRQLRRAIDCLPAKDGRLISLVYFEGRSVREAGRRLGWRKSTADRHHQAALGRLRALVGEDRSLLSPAPLGLAAWASAEAHGSSWIRRLAEGVRRLVPLAEPSGSLASAGAGRVAGVCGAGIVAALCGLGVSGAGPPLPWQGEPPRPPARERAAAPLHGGDRDPVVVASPPDAESQPPGRAPARSAREPQWTRHPRHRPAPRRPVERTPPAAPAAEEFAVEGTSTEGGSSPTSPPSTEPTAEETAPAPTPARPAAGSQVREEFGL